MTSMRMTKVPEDALRAAVESGMTDTNELAARFHVTERTIARRLVAYGIRAAVAPTAPLAEEVRVRAQTLADEGMPFNWIANEFGVTVDRLEHNGIRRAPGAVAEWKSAWAGIKRVPSLLALHYEIAPSVTRHGKTKEIA